MQNQLKKILVQNLKNLIKYNSDKNLHHVQIKIELSPTNLKEYEEEKKKWIGTGRTYSHEDYFMNFHYQFTHDLVELNGFVFYHMVKKAHIGKRKGIPYWILILGYRPAANNDQVVKKVKMELKDRKLKSCVLELYGPSRTRKAYLSLFKKIDENYLNQELYCIDDNLEGYRNFCTQLEEKFSNKKFIKKFMENFTILSTEKAKSLGLYSFANLNH